MSLRLIRIVSKLSTQIIRKGDEPQGFHDKVFHLINRQSCLFCDSLETHSPVIRVPLEH